MGTSSNKSANQANALAQEQFAWNKQQAALAEQEAARVRAEEQARAARVQQAVAQINAIYAGLGDAFFGQREQAYNDFYLPQVQDQYDEARSNLRFGLGQAGLLNSSIANLDSSKLARDKALRDAEIKSKAKGAASDLRGSVDKMRQSLIAQAQASEDPNTAVNLAGAQVNQVRFDPVSFDTLGNVFASASGAYGAYKQGKDYAVASGGGATGPGLPQSTGRRVM